MDEFSLYQKGIFGFLKNGRPPDTSREEFFYYAIVDEACRIGQSFSCSLEINARRLFEAQDYWAWDMQSMTATDRIGGPSPVVPCEFKHAAFLTYWLRRRLFVERVRKHPQSTCGQAKTDFYSDYATEMTAFLIGIRLCAYHVAKKTAQEAGRCKVVHLPGLQQRIRFDIAREYAILLRHKNVSPHALYLAFRSLLHVMTLRGIPAVS